VQAAADRMAPASFTGTVKASFAMVVISDTPDRRVEAANRAVAGQTHVVAAVEAAASLGGGYQRAVVQPGAFRRCADVLLRVRAAGALVAAVGVLPAVRKGGRRERQPDCDAEPGGEERLQGDEGARPRRSAHVVGHGQFSSVENSGRSHGCRGFFRKGG